MAERCFHIFDRRKNGRATRGCVCCDEGIVFVGRKGGDIWLQYWIWPAGAAHFLELAKIFVFLASDDASYLTGEVYGATEDEPLMRATKIQ
jgi:hypothetical protein